MPASRNAKGADRRAFYRRLEDRLRLLPGVQQVGETSQLPLTGSGPLQPFAYNEETARNFESVTADFRVVSPTWFQATDTRLLAGRTFTSQDSIGTPPVIMVDETLARLAWPGQSAVGKQLQIQPTGTPNAFAGVIGVVEHVRIHDLTRTTLPQIYFATGQAGLNTISFAVESAVDPLGLAGQVRRDVRLVARVQLAVEVVVQSGFARMVRHRSSISLKSLRARCSCAFVVPTARPIMSAIS
jgi:putative ABC transport system permease protein